MKIENSLMFNQNKHKLYITYYIDAFENILLEPIGYTLLETQYTTADT